MMRTLPNGSKRFCYGLFTAALVVSAVAGLLVASMIGDVETPQRTTLWTSAAVGGNLGPLLVDVFRRITHF